MSIGKNCIVIGSKIAYCPDNHAIIDLAALDLSSGPALLGPNGNTPYLLLLLLKADQIPQAIKILEEWEAKRAGRKPDTAADLGADGSDLGTHEPVGDGLDKLLPNPVPVHVLLDDGSERIACWHGKPLGWVHYDTKKYAPDLDIRYPEEKVKKWRYYHYQAWRVAAPPEGPYLQPENALFETLPEGVVP